LRSGMVFLASGVTVLNVSNSSASLLLQFTP
jgi:hypothetical protein